MDKLDSKVSKAGRVSACAVVGCTGLVVLIAMALFPMLVHEVVPPQKRNCESNLKQIGRAFRMYLEDWHDVYPTNRPILARGKVGAISSSVELTPAAEIAKGRKPRNLTWVEALYPYIEPPVEGDNGDWQCRNATSGRYPPGSKTAYTSYVFNCNMVQQPEQIIRNSDITMLVREVDRLVSAELRPTNYSCDGPGTVPISPFLTTHDVRFGKTESRLHGNGEYILFADSHVGYIDSSAFPERITRENGWDAKASRWRIKMDSGSNQIAITP